MTYLCLECAGHPAFPTVPALTRHRTTTHPTRPYPLPKEPTMTIGHTCPDCDQTFKNPQGLATHRGRIHGRTTVRPAPTRSTVDLAIAPVRRRLTQIDTALAGHDDLVAERDRLTRLLATLEDAR